MTDETSKRFAHVKFGVRTDVGRKRRNNEDAHGEWPAQGVFCVADGMGGAQDGEVASRAVIESLAGLLPRWAAFDPPVAQADRLDALARAIDAASFWIKTYADSQGKKGCGSTFVGVCLDPGDPGKAVAVHAGDSRVYRVRGKKIVQITRDHSVAQMAGVKDEKELSPMFRSLILRAVGIKPAVETERTPFDVAEGDRILVCSDGLSRMVPDKEIAKIAAAAETPDAAADALVDRANELGGKDNVTVVALFVGALPAPAGVHARLSGEEMAAFFAAPGREGDSSTVETEGDSTRSVDTGLTIPKGVGAFDTSSSGEFLPPCGPPPPTPELPDDDDPDDEDSPPPDTDEIPATVRMKRRLRGLSLALAHALRTPAGAFVAVVLAVIAVGGIAVPPAIRAAAERRQREEDARIAAEEKARIAAEKAARLAAEDADRIRKKEAFAAVRDEWNERASGVSNRIWRATATNELPVEAEIEKMVSSGMEALSSFGYTREYFTFAETVDAWSNQCGRIREDLRVRRAEMEKEADARRLRGLADALRRIAGEWNETADGLSNAVASAATRDDFRNPSERIERLLSDGLNAMSGSGEGVAALPEFATTAAAWSNRCDALVRQCKNRGERLDEEERERLKREGEKRLADAGKRLAGKVKDLEERAEALSGRIEQADSSEGFLAFGAEIEDLRSSGADAFSALDEDVKALPNFSTAIASWSNRCDALVARCETRERDLKAEENRIETENRRIAEQKKEEESKRDRDARLAERAKIWRRLADENNSEYRIDRFLDGVMNLMEKLRGMGTDEATKLANQISEAEADGFGPLCAVLEDVFVRPSLLWRFVAAPGVARAKARCGFSAGSDNVANMEDLFFAWEGLSALFEEGEPDADRWKTFHDMVCKFSSDAIGDETKPPAWDDNVTALFQVANGTIPGEDKDARECLDTYFSGWQSNPPKESAAHDDLKTVARCSKGILATWKEHPDAPGSMDRFALVIAGYETLLAYDRANYESARNKFEEGYGSLFGKYTAAEQYFKLLSPVSWKRMSGEGNDTAEGSR